MATKEDLFAAVKTITEECRVNDYTCSTCKLDHFCHPQDESGPFYYPPCYWPDPEEGGVKVEKNICFECKHFSEYPVCPATNDDIDFARNGDTIVSCKAYEETEGGGED